jgi:hypothetical protein
MPRGARSPNSDLFLQQPLIPKPSLFLPFKIMKTLRFCSSLVLGFTLLAGARAEETAIKFSDPTKPGTLRVQMFRGDVRIKGADVKEVTVRSDSTAVTKAPGKDGMRVISASSGFALGEKDNVIIVDSEDGWRGGGGSNFSITVPRNTNVIVTNAAGGGDVTCTDISGDLEIDAGHGEVELKGISGGALVNTLNGEIKASFTQMNDTKPISFSSLNGRVELELPGPTKANLKLRTQNGTIRSNFAPEVLITKVETTPGGTKSVRTISRSGNRNFSSDVQEALHDAAQASAEAIFEAQKTIQGANAAMRAGIDAAREARRSEDVRVEVKPRPSAAPDAPVPPAPARLPIARLTMTGGKLVTGTLNGGGPELSITTLNGDVTLRNIDAK